MAQTLHDLLNVFLAGFFQAGNEQTYLCHVVLSAR
jgi:hypothetical protein